MFDAGKDVYDRLKSIGTHNSIKELNDLRLGYKRMEKESREWVKVCRESAHTTYQADAERHEVSANRFKAMREAVEKYIKERKTAEGVLGEPSI